MNRKFGDILQRARTAGRWALIIGLIGAAAGCRNTQPLVGERPPHWAMDIDYPGLEDLAAWKVDETFYRGAMPTEMELAALKRMGIRTVINVRRRVSTRDMVESLGMQYIAIPIIPWDTQDHQVLQFLKVMKDPANHPVYMHCTFGGDRSAMLQGVYRMVYQDWTNDEAACEMAHGGYLFHQLWQNNVDTICEADARKLRRELNLTDAHIQRYQGEARWWDGITCYACSKSAKPGLLSRVIRALRFIAMLPRHHY